MSFFGCDVVYGGEVVFGAPEDFAVGYPVHFAFDCVVVGEVLPEGGEGFFEGFLVFGVVEEGVVFGVVEGVVEC